MRMPPRLKTRLDTRIPFRMRATAEAVSRYFRRNEGTTDYASIPEVVLSGDFDIEFDLLTDTQQQSTCLALYTSDTSEYMYIQVLSSGKIKISTSGFTPGNGLISVNNGVINKIKVVLSGSQFSVFVNGLIDYSVNHTNPSKMGKTYSVLINAAKQSLSSSNFDYLAGIIANLKIYDAGTLVRDYPLDEPKGTSVVYDNVAGNNGTIINGNDEDKGLFTKQANGDWKGSVLDVPPWDSVDQILVKS